MAHKKHPRSRNQSKKGRTGLSQPARPIDTAGTDRLEIVLKSDVMGSQEAICSAISASKGPESDIRIIHSDVGAVTKSDIRMAVTGSRLIIGFNVDVMAHMDQLCREQGVEIRLYHVIYHLMQDLKEITVNRIPPEAEEIITGEAKVIKLFKSSRRGIILGCEVLKGILAQGNHFRVISAMGPVYAGKIQSLQIENQAVHQATRGQQVGLKLSDFKDAKTGDLVECFKSVPPDMTKVWHPRGGVVHCDS